MFSVECSSKKLFLMKYLCPYLINVGIWVCAEGQRPGITGDLENGDTRCNVEETGDDKTKDGR